MLPPVDVLEVPGDDLDPLDERLDAGIPARLIDTARGVVAYRDVGDPAAPPLLATHAVPLSSLSWVSVAPYIAEHGLRFIALDMPGYGFTPPAPTALTMPEYADVIGALADALALDRFGLVGNATFAAAALHYAVVRPERVAKVVFTHFPYFPDPSRLAHAEPTWYHPDGSPPKIPMGSIQPRVSAQRFAVLRTRMAFDMYRSGPRSAEGYRALAAYDLLGDL
ncbi:MAG: alpha/beta hydrolase, partial [Dehalococcoidia bacterium]|nr:alpha/beta hydrolase [Dehalococcoidia bacterium]